jgi:hypothetical protein
VGQQNRCSTWCSPTTNGMAGRDLDATRRHIAALQTLTIERARTQKAKDDISIDWLRHRVNALEKEKRHPAGESGRRALPHAGDRADAARIDQRRPPFRLHAELRRRRRFGSRPTRRRARRLRRRARLHKVATYGSQRFDVKCFRRTSPMADPRDAWRWRWCARRDQTGPILLRSPASSPTRNCSRCGRNGRRSASTSAGSSNGSGCGTCGTSSTGSGSTSIRSAASGRTSGWRSGSRGR